MMVYLSKILPQLVYPLGLGLLFILVALIIFRKKRKAAFWLLLITLLMLGTAGNRIVSAALVRSLEWRYQPAQTLPQADVIVLLGGGTESADLPRPMTEVNGAGDRVIYAARLYQQGAAPAILLSGGNLEFSEGRGNTPAAEMQDLLLMLGVPEEALWLEDRSQNTAENALFARSMLQEKQIDTIILVTSAMHMPRSVKLFEAEGLTVIPAPTDYSITQRGWDEMMSWQGIQIPLNILPSSGALNQTTTALKEYLGMAVNWVSGH